MCSSPVRLSSLLTLCLALTLAMWLAVSSTAAAQSLTLAPGALSIVAVEGGANPPGQVFTVITSGPTVSWFATSGAPWLQVMPAAGEGPGSVFVSANVAALAAGTYTGTILITARQAGLGSRVVSVSLTVTPQSAPSQ